MLAPLLRLPKLEHQESRTRLGLSRGQFTLVEHYGSLFKAVTLNTLQPCTLAPN